MAKHLTSAIGESLSLKITSLKDVEGTAVTDASNYSCWFTLTKASNQTVAITTTLDISGYSASAGVVAVALTAANTTTLGAGTWDFSLRIEDGGLVSDLLTGTLTIDLEASTLTTEP